MYTDKVTMYIGRDSKKKFSDHKWHQKAEKKCKKISGRFDLGCNEQKRTSQSHVFCMASYCVCYIQYEKCSGITSKVEETVSEENDDEKIEESGESHDDEFGGDYENEDSSYSCFFGQASKI